MREEFFKPGPPLPRYIQCEHGYHHSAGPHACDGCFELEESNAQGALEECFYWGAKAEHDKNEAKRRANFIQRD